MSDSHSPIRARYVFAVESASVSAIKSTAAATVCGTFNPLFQNHNQVLALRAA